MGSGPSRWLFEGWLYNDIYYETTEAFRAAYYSPGFVKLGANVEGNWARTDQQGPVPQFDQSYPPSMIATRPRYLINLEHKYVHWMGFTFFLGYSRDTGMALYDINYEGKRIMYELGLQEVLAHYAS